MKYLLDTHTFLWYDARPEKLSDQVKTICETKTNVLLLSLVSIWELQIKIQIGKLTLPLSLQETIRQQVEKNNVRIFSIRANHIYGLEKLLLHHNDPFDRLLLAQALVEDIPLLSSDSNFAPYPVNVIW